MASSKWIKRANKAPPQTKDSVMGYIRMLQNELKLFNIPLLIKHCVLSYYLLYDGFGDHSEFVVINESGNMAKARKDIYQKGEYEGAVFCNNTLDLSNKDNCGKKWVYKFKVCPSNSGMYIGISTSQSKELETDDVLGFLWNTMLQFDDTSYALRPTGKIKTLSHKAYYQTIYPEISKSFEGNESTVEITIECLQDKENKWTSFGFQNGNSGKLTFRIINHETSHQEETSMDIEPRKFRLVVVMHLPDHQIQILESPIIDFKMHKQ